MTTEEVKRKLSAILSADVKGYKAHGYHGQCPRTGERL
jgi:hypothetical protein